MDLNQLFESLQEEILKLYEEENTDLESQLKHWRLQRRSSAVQYYARQQGLKRLGLQPVPSLASSEAAGKTAIEMTMLIHSLMQSPFANESWTLQDTSADLVLRTAPQRTFKKLPYNVEVWFDNDASNTFPYTNFRLIYAKDENDQWYKAEGRVEYDGMYFEEANGDKAFYKLFADDARIYSNTGIWSVHYNNHILSPPSSSSRTRPGSSNVIVLSSDEGEPEPEPGPSSGQYSIPEKERDVDTFQPSEEGTRRRRSTSESSQTSGVERGDRRGPGDKQREPRSPPVKRAKADSSGGVRRRGARGGGGTGGGGRSGERRGTTPEAEEVGSRHHTVDGRGLSKLGRLQAEAWDPLIIIVKGPANALKCWRFRLKAYRQLYEKCTTVFKWIDNECETPNSRILLSFKSNTQRQQFVTYVKTPKHCNFSFGSLDSL